MASAQFELGEYEDAANGFAQGGDLSADNLRDYAVCLGRLGQVDEAEQTLEKLIGRGAHPDVTQYVQDEVYFAMEDYLAAETAFLDALEQAESSALTRRCYISLGDLYRDCAALSCVNASPIQYLATKSVHLLSEAVAQEGLRYDSVLWEMLAMAYFEAYHTDPSVSQNYQAALAEHETAGSMIRSSDETTYYQQLGSLIDNLKKMGGCKIRKRERKIFMKRIANLLLVLAILVGVTACGNHSGSQREPNVLTWQEQYDLGVRYLEESNYEEAIIAFTAAIEIDPKRADSYIHLAEAYEALGNVEKARQTLEDALSVVSDPNVIQTRLDSLSDGESASDSMPVYTPDTTLEDTEKSTPPQAEPDVQEPEIPEPEQTSLTLSNKEVNMFAGNRFQLRANGAPSGTQVSWTSSSSDITVDRNGLITANNDGYLDFEYGDSSATITASYQYNGETYSDSCTVNVEFPYVGAVHSKSNDYWVDLAVGEVSQVKYETNIPNATIQYRISNDSTPGAVRVDNRGRIEAIKEGGASIIVSAIYKTDLETKSDTLYWGVEGTEVDLKENEYFDVIYVTVFDPSWYFGHSETTLYLNNPQNAMNDYTRYYDTWYANTTLRFNTTVNVECKDPSVAVVNTADDDGVSSIKAVGVGTTTAVATWTYNGVPYSQSMTITVLENAP